MRTRILAAGAALAVTATSFVGLAIAAGRPAIVPSGGGREMTDDAYCRGWLPREAPVRQEDPPFTLPYEKPTDGFSTGGSGPPTSGLFCA